MSFQIPESYFRDETREGFQIPAKMKRAWAAKMKMLVTMAEIMDKEGITWWADYGTLLGAVRHGGFIPWDDDIDISLPRPDYERALAVLAEELPAHYTVIRMEQDPPVPWSCVRNRKEIDFGENEESAAITKEFFDCPYSCAIDLFPLDYVPKDPGEREIFFQLLHMTNATAYYYHRFRREGVLEEWLEQIEAVTEEQLPRGEDGQMAVYRLLDQLSQIYDKEDSCGLAVITNWVGRGKEYRPLSWYEETDHLPFEMLSLPVPHRYEQVLGNEYGDWHIPIKGTSDHDYPFYKGQDELIRNRRKQMR